MTDSVIVGVLTRAEPTDRRHACSETWVRRLNGAPGVRVVYLAGGSEGEARLDGDVLYLPCGDGYESLVYKTREFCRWALTQDFAYLFKCDDDTFVVADRFLRFDPAGHDYVGVDPVDHINPTFASGGAGYWLSRQAAERVAAMDVASVSAAARTNGEDYCVYWALKDEFRFHNDQHFQAWMQPHRTPRSSNEIITVHYVSPDEMRRLDAYFDELGSVAGYDGYDRGSNTRFAAHFGALQVDWMGTLGSNDGPIVLQESLSVAGDGPHLWARSGQQPTFTYLCQLDGFENFRFAALPYDFEYMRLVTADDPLNRTNKAAYVFSRKTHRYTNGTLFGVAPFRCNYDTRYAISRCAEYVDSSSCGSSVLDKLRHLNQFKFAVACENLIADGYITEKLLDCFQADTVPIFVGGWLPEFLETCVVRLEDVSSDAAIRARLGEILNMPDAQYVTLLERIRALRFGHELYGMFSYQSFFNTIGVEVDTARVRFDDSTI